MKRAVVIGATFLCGALAQSQPALNTGIETRLDFEDGRTVFKEAGATSAVSLTREAANVKIGRSALRFDYKVAMGQVNYMQARGEAGAVADIKSFRFWIKADYTTTIILALEEKDGGRYGAFIHVPKDTWQRVELNLSDFLLFRDADDPIDPNNKLDMDMVESAACVDAGQIFVQTKNESVKKLLGVKTGDHVLFLDDFWASKDALPATPGVDPKDSTIIDVFTAPQLSWLTFGNALLKRVTAKELEALGQPASVRERGLAAEYRQQTGVPTGFVRAVPSGRLSGMTALKFTVATDKPLTLVVQFEENDSELIGAEDLKNAGGLIGTLRDSQDALPQYLRGQFSPAFLQRVKTHVGNNAPSQSLQQALIDELNRLLQGGSIYDKTRFAGITLRTETQNLLMQNPKNKVFVRLNRFLLEDAFAQYIARSQGNRSGKYHTTVDLPGDGKAVDVRLVPALFEPSDDSKDDNKHLDLDQIKQIVFLDPTGLFGGAVGDNQLWLSNLRIEKPAP